MAFELNKFQKYTWLLGVYSFYNVFAQKYPADPIAGMIADLKSWMTDPIAKIKTKTQEFTVLVIVIIAFPILSKMIGGKIAALKIVINALAYYIIGEQVGKIVDGTPVPTGASYGRRGAVQATWGGETSAFHQNSPPVGTISNIYSSR